MLTEVLCGSRAVRFSTDLFDADTVKKAAYRLTDRCAFEFSTEPGIIICEARFSSLVASDVADDLELRLCNEVLEQDLRKRISEETAAMRNAILAYAFSDAGLQGGE